MSLKTNFFYINCVKLPLKKLICLSRGVKAGSNVYISWKASIRDPHRVALADNVVIEPHARLACFGPEASIRLGEHCFIRPYAYLKADHGRIILGDRCSVNDYCILYGHGDLVIGNDVHIAAHTVIVPMNHNFSSIETPMTFQGINKKGITIEDDVWIGANCTILDGVTLGKGSVIGAGSVVTRTIPPYSVAVGSPARVIRSRK